MIASVLKEEPWAISTRMLLRKALLKDEHKSLGEEEANLKWKWFVA